MNPISSEERSRRQSIVRAVEAISLRIESYFDRQHETTPDLDQLISDVLAMTRHTLDLFQLGDEGVAWWTQVELYSALAEPLSKASAGAPLINELGESTFTLPRYEMLLGWSEGTSLGPRFRGQEHSAPENMDRLRENFVRPFSEAPDNMVWAKILQWSNQTSG